ncbi:MAG: PorT family protein [Muribaculaceae bacterium]|nr:PorT family protein [Muribaculaceae bacterium]
MQRLRTTIAALLAGLISLTSAAQINWWDSSKSGEGISLSAQFGLNLSHFTHVERWSSTKAGINIGVFAEKPILNSLAVKAGALYSMKGAIGKNDGGFGGDLTTTFSPAYLEIPILASYRIQHNDALSFTFDFGPYFAFGLHGKDVKDWKAGSIGSDTPTAIDVFSDSQLKRFDFGFQFGPSVVYKNRLSAGIIFDCGAADISNMGGKVGNFTAMINVAYRFLTL